MDIFITSNLYFSLACDLYMKLSGNKIRGGTPAADGEFPWMVFHFTDLNFIFSQYLKCTSPFLKAALGYVDYNNDKYEVTFKCGGTIISDHFILTAGHCVPQSDPPTVVRLGKVSKNRAYFSVKIH